MSVSRDEIGRGATHPEPVDLFALLLSLRACSRSRRTRRACGWACASAPACRAASWRSRGCCWTSCRISAATPSNSPRRRGGDPCRRVAASRRRNPAALRGARHRHRDRPQDQERIFEAFVQAAPDIAERFGGSGLGLAIVRRRLEARGGRIGVESTPARGRCSGSSWRSASISPRAAGRSRPRWRGRCVWRPRARARGRSGASRSASSRTNRSTRSIWRGVSPSAWSRPRAIPTRSPGRNAAPRA